MGDGGVFYLPIDCSRRHWVRSVGLLDFDVGTIGECMLDIERLIVLLEVTVIDCGDAFFLLHLRHSSGGKNTGSCL